MDLASDFEQTIRQHRLPALAESFRGEGFVLPHYGGLSIANLPATVAALLDIRLEDSGVQAGLEPPLPRRAWSDLVGDVRCVVMVILDAVGYLHARRLFDTPDMALGRLARAGTFVPLTSVFPTTTMAAITTLWTGRTPIDHGFLGRKLFLSEFGVLADMIRLMPATHGRPGELLEWGWVPEDFIPVPHMAQIVSAAGVRTVTHLYGPHAGGGLSRLFLRGVASVRGFINYSDMWINVRETLMQRSGDPLLVNVYWSGTDDVAHAYGPDDERFAAALRHMARSIDEDFLGPLPKAAREGTVLIVTADHGQIETPPGRAVRLSEHPALSEMLCLPPAAEPRASYLHVRRGKTASVRAYVADRFLLLDIDQAVRAGLFGPGEVSPGTRSRLGDMLLLARDDSRLIPQGETARDRGEHGSLTPEEMLVPLVMARLDA